MIRPLVKTKKMSELHIFDRLKNGITVQPDDPDRALLREASFATMQLLRKLNQSSNPEEIRAILSEITNTEIDSSVGLFPPLYMNYGKHTKIGKNVFINFNCVFLDWGGITIEDDVLIAPNVSLLTEGHSISPSERQGLIPKPIHIKRNVWIGANATVLQGVTIGENSIVAAGSVVSSDVPDNVLVGGIPAKVIKTIE